MNLEKLETILNDNTNNIEEIYEFFEVKSKKEMEELVRGNLSRAKIKLNDEYGYDALEAIREQSIEKDDNPFFEELMLATVFLKSFAGYEINVLKAFVEGIGIINFVFLAREVFENNKKYEFFKEYYDRYKENYYKKTLERTAQTFFDAMEEQFNNIDIKEFSKTVEEINKLKK